MMLLGSFITIFMIMVDNVKSINTHVNNHSETADIRAKLITDIVEELGTTYNFVFIATPEDVYVIHEVRPAHYGMFTSSLCNYDDVTSDTLKEMNQPRVKHNIPSLYTILHPDNRETWQLMWLVEHIKWMDPWWGGYPGKVLIIYQSYTDISMAIFADLEFRITYNLWQQIDDIFILNPSASQPSVYKMYEICKFCNFGEEDIRKINTWGEVNKFMTKFHLPPSFKGLFYHTSLTMGIPASSRFIYKCRYSKRKFCGSKYHHYMFLARMLKLSWKFTYASRNSLIKAKHIDGNALMYDLLHGKIDVRGGGYLMSYTNNRKYSGVSANTYYSRGRKIISIEPAKSLPWFGLCQAFAWYTWILILITVPSVGLTMYILEKYKREHTPVDDHVSVSRCMWQAVVIICWDSIQIHRPSCHVCFLLTSNILHDNEHVVSNVLYGELHSNSYHTQTCYPTNGDI